MKKLFILLCLLFILCSCTDTPSTDAPSKELSKEEIATVYQNAADYVKNLTTGSKVSSLSYQESAEYDTLNSIIALVKLASNLYSTETFVISEEFVEFNLALEGTALKMLLLTETNIDESKLIATYIYYFADSEINEQALLVQADIDYNFETNQISGFEIRQISCAGDGVNLHFKYDGSKFYEFDPFDEPENQEEYDLIVSKTIAIRDEYIVKVLNAVKLEQDYSAEYLSAMEFAFS